MINSIITETKMKRLKIMILFSEILMIVPITFSNQYKGEDIVLPDIFETFKQQMAFSCLQWTPWLSADLPTGEGDWETISSPRDMGVPGTINRYIKGVHVCTMPISIQCRSRHDNRSWTDSNDHFQVPCVTRRGLVCRTQDQLYEKMCRDYEVRFLCWKPCPYLKWSNWSDYDDPDEQGDLEILGQTIPREKWPCEGGEFPVDVECETLSGIPIHQSKKRGLKCDTSGFSCFNELQGPDCHCDDFKVRFLCPLESFFPISNHGEKH